MTDPTLVHLVRTVPDAITVERDHTYAPDLAFHVYRPAPPGPHPAIVLVAGFPNPGLARKPMTEWASYVDWARLLAASGVAAILYVNREPADALALFAHLHANAAALGLDPARIGVWACSGHVPVALALAAKLPIACAALLYGYTLDLDGATDVADAAKRFFFGFLPIGIADLPATMPMLVVRAGRDTTPGLDVALQRFIAAARARDMAITVVEHADGVHAFDLVDDSLRTHAVIDEVVAFVRRALSVPYRGPA